MTMRSTVTNPVLALLCGVLLPLAHGLAAEESDVEKVTAEAVRPVMERYAIPGMAVGIVVHGRPSVFNYGVSSKATGRPVAEDTLFEIGSLSKTFTATLASYAELKGRLSFSDATSRYVPALRGSAFDHVSLLNLGTHTTGGMPAQFPDDVTTDDETMGFFKAWAPAHPPGTDRTYANPSIGLLGLITAKSMNQDFEALMASMLFHPLGMEHAFITLPPDEASHYAQGYTKADAPIRMAPGPLAAQAYGIKTTASDLVRFVEANMDVLDVDDSLQKAILATHTGYFTLGAMTQDLIWEQYRAPVALDDLLQGNSSKVSAEPNPVSRLDPPLPPREDVLINKTGSTNGFAAYVAFIPQERLGIVLLANKNYPVPARVSLAYDLLSRLGGDAAHH